MFKNSIVTIFSGKKLSDFPVSNQSQIAQYSVDKFVQWLYLNLLQKSQTDPKAKTAAIRIKAAYKFRDQNVFAKFPETQTYMMQAYNDLILSLK